MVKAILPINKLDPSFGAKEHVYKTCQIDPSGWSLPRSHTHIQTNVIVILNKRIVLILLTHPVNFITFINYLYIHIYIYLYGDQHKLVISILYFAGI